MAKNMFKSLLLLAFSLFTVLICNTPAHAQADPATVAKGNEKLVESDFDVTDTILEHIGDGYSWHLWGKTSLPLTVILHTDKGFEVFSSAHLEDANRDPIVYNGNYPYKIIAGKIK